MIARHLSETELTEYAGQELHGARRAWAAEHVEQCPACSEALQRLQEAIASVRPLRTSPPPSDLRQRLAAKLAIEPAPALSCRRARQMLQESLDGALSPFASGALQFHLDGCPACRAELASLRETTEAVRSLTPVSAPEFVWQAVHAASRLRPIQAPWGARLRPAFAAAAVTAVSGLLLLFHTAPQPVVTNLASHPTAQPAPVQTAQAAPVTPVPPRTTSVAPVAGNRRAPRVAPQPEIAVAELPAEPVVRSERTVRPSVSLIRATRGPGSLHAAPRPEPSPTRATAVAVLPARVDTAVAIQPAVSPRRPAALRVLTAVAKAAAYDIDPHASLASAGERLATLDSEAAAAGALTLPGGDAGKPGRGHESGETVTPNRADTGETGRNA